MVLVVVLFCWVLSGCVRCCSVLLGVAVLCLAVFGVARFCSVVLGVVVCCRVVFGVIPPYLVVQVLPGVAGCRSLF